MTLLHYARAFAVHLLTAAGAALALLALLAAVRGAFDLMFLCLGIALVVDGIDGTIARALDVAELLPRWSGDVLDLVVDFVTYVFVPAYAIAASGYLPEFLAIPLACVIVITGALYFADGDMKIRAMMDGIERPKSMILAPSAEPSSRWFTSGRQPRCTSTSAALRRWSSRCPTPRARRRWFISRGQP